MAVIRINGVAPAAEITSYEWGISDLDGGEGTGRAEATGKMFRDRVARVRRLTIYVGPSTVGEMAQLQGLVAGEFVSITYLDALTGGWKTDDFYVADRGVQALMWDGDLDPGVSTDFSSVKWGPCSMEFIGEGNPVDEEDE